MTIRLAIIEFHESLSSLGKEFPQGELRFKLIETYQTSDGMRSRLCDGLWASKSAARNEMRRRMGLPEEETASG